MRFRIICLLAALAMAPMLHAQVEVKVLLKQKQFLVKESLEVGIRVVNHSGQTLNLKKGDWLSLSVMDANDFSVKQIGKMPVAEDVSVETSYEATQWLDIGQTFDFRENARYSVRARINVSDWNRDYFSTPKEFEMIRGASLWEQKFGVPAKAGTPPEFRTYILQQALYLSQPELYVRITDESGRTVHAVHRIAPMIQVSRPEAQVDTLSRLHVFTQVGMRDFVHIIVGPDGEIQRRDTYVIDGFRPSLKVSPSGGVYVSGGLRQLRPTDIPTPKMYVASAADKKIDAEVDKQVQEEESGLADPVPVAPTPAAPKADPFEQAQKELDKMTAADNAPSVPATTPEN